MAGKRMLVVGLSLTLLAVAGRAADWPQFRGPGNAGVASDGQLPEQWAPDKNVAWKVKLPGYGWSSPVVCGDKVLVTTAVSDKQQKPAAGMGGMGGFRGGPPRGDFPPRGGPRPGGFRGGFGGGKPPDAVYRWEIHCLDRTTGKTLWSQV